MNKKFITIGLTCLFLLVAGVCYSCTFRNNASQVEIVESKKNGNSNISGRNDNKLEAGTTEGKKSGNVYISAQPESSTAASDKVKESSRMKTLGQNTIIYVHICGAVKNPGVYQAKEGARLFDFIKLAGGLSKAADGNYTNQAQKVSDGQRIYIPTRNEVKKLSTGEYMAGAEANGKTKSESQDASEDKILVNINEADSNKLMELPGIGKAKADKIIEYRSANGNFKKIEDIMNIPGIKEGLFQKISPYITV